MAYKYIEDEIEPYFDLIMDCIKLNGKDIKKTIEKITNDTKWLNECLDDNFLEFKLHSKKIREEYENAVNDELEKTEIVWDKCDQLIRDSKPTIDKAASLIEGLLSTIRKINSNLDGISIWKIEKMIELIEKFSKLTEEEKNMFKILLDNK